MAGILDRVVSTGGVARLRGSEVEVDQILTALAEGHSPAKIRSGPGIGAAEIAACLAWAGLGEEGSLGPRLRQGRASRPELARVLNDAVFATLWPEDAEEDRLAMVAGLAQALDFWDLSHDAAQRADDLGETATSRYWHAIAHRREPDAGNAAYWFRRVGNHPLFPELAQAASEVIADGDSRLRRVVRGDRWDPFGFVEECVALREGMPDEPNARRIQRLEMDLLLGFTLARLGRNRG